MNRNTLIAFAAITLTVVITAAVVVTKERAPTSMSHELLFPTLTENINQAASISLVSNRHKTLLERDGETWRIANSDDYPALFDKVRNLLINLRELRTLERKTNNPELYHRLDVQNPSQPDSNSVQITVADKDGNMLADVIIGKPRKSKVTNLQTGLYVRRPEDKHALLVEGEVPVSAEKTAWFNPNVLNIPSERVQEVIIRHPDGNTMHVRREGPQKNFKVVNLPADRDVKSQVALNKFGSILQEISVRDIRALGTFEFTANTVETTVQTFNGLVIDVRSMKAENRYYANFQFRYDESAAPADSSEKLDQLLTPEGQPSADGTATQTMSAEAEALDLQQRLSDWVYQIPGFKYEVMSATLDDYTRQINE